MKNYIKLLPGIFALIFTGCYSVFDGGLSGTVVDAESTSTPKDGIAYVDVYAYTSESDMESDYSSWTEGETFTPQAEYYGHTSTNTSGEFSLSKIVWKTYSSTFGKDADVENVYLLFYHENYGLTKGSTLVVSDSVSDTVYQELTKTRMTTVLTVNLVDVSSESNTSETVYVKVEVPQTTATLTDVSSKTFDATITGTGTISITYPRYKDSAHTTETTPDVTISYYQSSDDVTWKGCYNGDSTDSDYAFYDDDFTVTKTIPSYDTYSISLYGKACKFSVPTFSGQYVSSNDASADGVLIGVLVNGVDCGTTTTASQTVGTSSTEKHGVFSGLGSGTWSDSTYPDKYTTAEVSFTANESSATSSITEIRSDTSTYTVQLQ